MYLSLFTIHNLALLSDWLAETGELFVDVDLPHSGGSSYFYFIQTMDEFRALVAQQDWPEVRITVFRRMQYPLRGKVDCSFIEDVLAKIPDGQLYTILTVESESTSPQSNTVFGRGNSHEELKKA